MKYRGKTLAALAGGFSLCTIVSGLAITSGTTNPYEDIISRNAFALKPLPPPPDPNDTPKQPPVKITVTGITTVIGKRVLMETPGPAPKPGEQPKPKMFYMLAEGERDGDIEVISIDEKTGNVKVKNQGQEFTLNIDKDGAKLPATIAPAPPAIPGGPPGALPGLPHAPGANLPMPTKMAEGGSPSGFSLPSRIPRTNPTGSTPGFGATPTGASLPTANGTLANTGNTGIPIASLMNSSATPPSQMQKYPPEIPMSPEEQAIMIEAQRQMLISQGNAAAASMLPTTGAAPGNNNQQQRSGPPPLPGR